MRKKRDRSHSELSALARSLGLSTIDVTQGESVGFDEIWAVHGRTCTVEIKSAAKSKLTKIERNHAEDWLGWHVCVHAGWQVGLVCDALLAGHPPFFSERKRWPGWS